MCGYKPKYRHFTACRLSLVDTSNTENAPSLHTCIPRQSTDAVRHFLPTSASNFSKSPHRKLREKLGVALLGLQPHLHLLDIVSACIARIHSAAGLIGRVSYIWIYLYYFCFRWKTVSLVQASMQHWCIMLRLVFNNLKLPYKTIV